MAFGGAAILVWALVCSVAFEFEDAAVYAFAGSAILGGLTTYLAIGRDDDG